MKSQLDAILGEHGHVLLRDTNFSSAEDFHAYTPHILSAPMSYKKGTADREVIHENVMNVGYHPNEVIIEQHNEMSYSDTFPRIIAFGCKVPGGNFSISSNREFTKNIPTEIKQKAKILGVQYIRNFASKDSSVTYGQDWEYAFGQTKKDAEEECGRLGYDFSWEEDDVLQVRYTKPAFIEHPRTKEEIWWNQLLILNGRWFNPIEPWNQFPLHMRPHHTQWGDGSVALDDELDAVEDAQNSVRQQIDWQTGDIFVLDNLQYTHGRDPFTGYREILVMMGDPMERSAVALQHN